MAIVNGVRLLHLHQSDNIAVLAQDAAHGALAAHQGTEIIVSADLGMGHKIAITPIRKGQNVLKYGAPIGFAACDIKVGEHVHLHNLTSRYTVIKDMEVGQK